MPATPLQSEELVRKLAREITADIRSHNAEQLEDLGTFEQAEQLLGDAIAEGRALLADRCGSDPNVITIFDEELRAGLDPRKTPPPVEEKPKRGTALFFLIGIVVVAAIGVGIYLYFH